MDWPLQRRDPRPDAGREEGVVYTALLRSGHPAQRLGRGRHHLAREI